MGSNQNGPERQLRQAIKALRNLPHTSITNISSFHWTPAWGLQRQPNFCNAVVELSTHLLPQSVLKYCQKIELDQGRVRKKRWGPRTLDIDIILFGDRVIQTKDLSIPHPRMHLRDFVLIPLREVLP